MAMEKTQSPKKKDPTKSSNKGLNDFARYTGMAFQMFGIIFVTAWGGSKLDRMAGNKTPVFTIILSLLGVFAALYTVLKDFIKRN